MLHAAYGTDLAIVLVWENEREPVKRVKDCFWPTA